MGALGKPRPGYWLALAICAVALVAPAAAMAQSSEITKSLPGQTSDQTGGQTGGQTEIRKSPPGAAPRERTPQRVEQPPQERPMEARPVDAWETKSQRATLLPTLEWPTDAGGQGVTVTQAEVTKAGALTRFSLLLSARVPYHVSYLANPYRVVLDTPDVEFRLPVTAGRQGQGLIRAYRYGLFAPGKARVVIDTAQPVRVQRQAMNMDPAGGGARLVLDLAPTDEETFLASIAPPPAAAPTMNRKATTPVPIPGRRTPSPSSSSILGTAAPTPAHRDLASTRRRWSLQWPSRSTQRWRLSAATTWR